MTRKNNKTGKLTVKRLPRKALHKESHAASVPSRHSLDDLTPEQSAIIAAFSALPADAYAPVIGYFMGFIMSYSLDGLRELNRLERRNKSKTREAT